MSALRECDSDCRMGSGIHVVRRNDHRGVAAKRERDGISVDDNTWKEILAAAAKVKLDPAQIEKLARS